MTGNQDPSAQGMQSQSPSEMTRRKLALWDRLEAVKRDPQAPEDQRAEAQRRQDVLLSMSRAQPPVSNS